MTFKQKNQRLVDKMPFLSSAYKYEDWNARAKKMDALLFEFAKNPEYVEPSYDSPYGPIGYWDKTNSTFGLPSYLGHVGVDEDTGKTVGTMRPGSQESLPAVNAVFGASLCGIDKSKQTFTDDAGNSYTYDFVTMLRAFYSGKYQVFSNNVGGAPGDSFWYNLYPHIMISRICELYPNLRDDASKGLSLKQMILNSASKWLTVSKKMLNSGKITYSSYDFDTNEFTIKEVNGHQYIEPPVGGFLYIFYNAYKLSGDSSYINDGIVPLLDWMETHNINPNYEIMSDYIPYVASLMNYRFKKSYNVDRYLNFLVENDSDCRAGMGLSCAQWGNFDAYGLATFEMKDTDNKSGYAFLMNTFHLLSTLAPMLNYSPSYANIVGKWILNVTNSARIFYGGTLDSSHQSCPVYSTDPDQTIGYEGCRTTKNKKTPYACGDPTAYGWGKTDYGIYGSSLVGVFGGLVSKTSDERILRTDLSKADSLSENSYQSYLYFNPYEETKYTNLSVSSACDVFDVTNNEYIAKNAEGAVKLTLPARSSLIIKLLPTESKVTRSTDAKGINAYKNGYYLCGNERISMFSRPCLNLDTKVAPKSSYSDSLDLKFASQVSSEDSISKFEVYANGTLIESLSYGDSYSLDVSKIKSKGISGDALVTFKIYSKTYGLSDSASIRINVE